MPAWWHVGIFFGSIWTLMLTLVHAEDRVSALNLNRLRLALYMLCSSMLGYFLAVHGTLQPGWQDDASVVGIGLMVLYSYRILRQPDVADPVANKPWVKVASE